MSCSSFCSEPEITARHWTMTDIKLVVSGSSSCYALQSLFKPIENQAFALVIKIRESNLELNLTWIIILQKVVVSFLVQTS